MSFKHKLQAGTKYHTSIVGHRNFVYPSTVQDTLIEDADVTTLSWVGGGQMEAVKVSEHALKHDGDATKKVIIWVEKKEIL